MAITKTITANGSNGHHKFALRVNEDTTSGNSSFMGYSFTLSPIQTGWDWYGWGSKISYEIKIGDNTFNGTISDYNGSSTITLSSGSNIEVPHNSDGTKTINISFSVTDTTGQSYTCGNASDSSDMVLSVLHKAPEITSVDLVENNAKLTSLSVPNNTIVQYLSNKKFTVSATYDDAIISNCSIYHNNVLIGTSTTNEVVVDFSKVSELITTEINGTHYVGLTIAVTDSKSGYSTRIFNFSVIKYTRPTIEKTSTTIKRKTGNGTVLTDNIAVLNFVATCYKGNDVIGNANIPTVQYKIWNDTEPDYTVLTTPNTANVTIKDYEISDILYTSSYNYKIKITDTFTTTETTINVKIDKLPTGVSVWTEYQDRVNFIRATINGNDIVESGENDNGSWVKYYDGTLICQGSRTFNININTAWGSLFETTDMYDFGQFPIQFVDIPEGVYLTQKTGPTCFHERIQNTTKANIGSTWFTRPTSMESEVTWSFLAIGKWK